MLLLGATPTRNENEYAQVIYTDDCRAEVTGTGDARTTVAVNRLRRIAARTTDLRPPEVVAHERYNQASPQHGIPRPQPLRGTRSTAAAVLSEHGGENGWRFSTDDGDWNTLARGSRGVVLSLTEANTARRQGPGVDFGFY
jgi:hypothetical protein